MSIAEEFNLVLQTFTKEQVAYALCGGFALAAYGIVRATEDIDFLVPENGLAQTKIILATLGYSEEKSPLVFRNGQVTIHPLFKPDLAAEDFVVIDLLIVGELTRSAWESRRTIETDLGPLVVVSPAGLIALMQLRGSGQDLDDIAKLNELK